MSSNARVCIIGAGAAGLCAARHLAPLKNLQPVVYEQSKDIGGTWIFNPKTGQDEQGLPIHSSMYKTLKTNLPKEVMAFPDYPFPSGRESFLHHTEVCAYLRSYASHFCLDKFIHLNNLVKHVVPLEDGSGWSVTVENLETRVTSSSTFVAVMVCNGHYSVPSMPELPGKIFFDGEVMHSHDYRTPEPFKNKTVVVLGAAASGTDIGLEIATTAKRLFLCHNNPELPSALPENVHQRKGIKEIAGPKKVLLVDDSVIDDIDVILYCTGYHYSFPFLDQSCHPRVENRVVWPLFKHMLHIDFPTLCFIGIPIQICPFPQFDLQVQLFVKSLTGEVTLPTRTEMLEDTMQEKAAKQSRGIHDKHFHKMGASQWDYNRSLCQLANLPPLPTAVERLYNHVHDIRRHNLTSYKSKAFDLNDFKEENHREVA